MRISYRVLAGGLLAAGLLAGGAQAAELKSVKPEEVASEEVKAEAFKPGVKEAIASGASPLEQTISDAQSGVAFNDAVLVLIRNSGAEIFLMPEMSDPILLKKPVDVQSGVTLRTALDHLCGQVGAKWETLDNGKTITIAPAGGIVKLTDKGSEPLKSKVSVSCSGVPLSTLIQELRQITGVAVTAAQPIQGLQVELSVEGWEVARVLGYLCFQYDLEQTPGKDGMTLNKKKN